MCTHCKKTTINLSERKERKKGKESEVAWQHAVSETLPVDIRAAVEMRQSGHICDSSNPCLLETPGYDLNESPYSVTDMLAEVGGGDGDPVR